MTIWQGVLVELPAWHAENTTRCACTLQEEGEEGQI
jgi:hypothetical protein